MNHEWEHAWTEHMNGDSFYNVLGVPRSANRAELKKAYRRQAMLHHPDRNDGQDARFKQVYLAHSVLSDTGTRMRYNNMLDRSIRDRSLFDRIVKRMEDDKVRFDSEVYSMYRSVFIDNDKAQANNAQASRANDTGQNKDSTRTDTTQDDSVYRRTMESMYGVYQSVRDTVPWRKIGYTLAGIGALGIGYKLAVSDPVQDLRSLEQIVQPATCENVHALYENAKVNGDYEQVRMYRGILRSCKE